MTDVQSQIDKRSIRINKVGVKGIKYPIKLLSIDNVEQSTVADINMYVSLKGKEKGTHMSRFVEILNKYQHGFSIDNIKEMLYYMREHLGSEDAHIEMSFPYFINKEAPVSGAKGLMDYKCRVKGILAGDNGAKIVLGVTVPVTSLCPCSKEVSEFGAHNQRSEVSVDVISSGAIWFDKLIELIEGVGSCEIYSLVKRADEKYMTEKAYLNPKFVEDIVRDVTGALTDEKEIIWFEVESENIESIHNHNAYAKISRGKQV